MFLQVSYIGTNSQGEIFNDHDIRQADNSSSSIYTWTGLMPGDYEFSVIAFTSRGPGDPAVIPVELGKLIISLKSLFLYKINQLGNHGCSDLLYAYYNKREC